VVPVPEPNDDDSDFLVTKISKPKVKEVSSPPLNETKFIQCNYPDCTLSAYPQSEYCYRHGKLFENPEPQQEPQINQPKKKGWLRLIFGFLFRDYFSTYFRRVGSIAMGSQGMEIGTKIDAAIANARAERNQETEVYESNYEYRPNKDYSVWTYQCIKCGNIQSYSAPPVPVKCPSCGSHCALK